MNYQDWINEVSVLLPQALASGVFNATAPFLDANYNVIIPRAIEYAELMMYRDPDLNFITTRKVDASGNFTSGSRSFITTGNIIIVEQLAAITPVGAGPAGGTRVQFQRTSVDFINQAWPTEATVAAPSVAGPGPWFAMLTDTAAIVAPTPDQNYTAEVTGVFRPTPLAQNAAATSYLTLNLPDLFIAASMIYWAGVMKDYGAQTDDPKLAQSWSNQYEVLKKGAAVESARQRAQSAGWSPYTPTPVATPPRS